MSEPDPLKLLNNNRQYCNIKNKNNLSFTCFSENDIYELKPTVKDPEGGPPEGP